MVGTIIGIGRSLVEGLTIRVEGLSGHIVANIGMQSYIVLQLASVSKRYRTKHDQHQGQCHRCKLKSGRESPSIRT